MKTINSDLGDIHITSSGIYCNNQKLEYLDSGAESHVYQYNDKAIKIYREIPNKRVLSESMINKLKGITTKRVIMPEGILYEDNKIKGLYMPYIKGQQSEVYNLEKEKLIEEFSYIYDDLSILGKEQIIIDDLRMSNFICNSDAFYLIDTGDYYINKNIKNTTRINQDEFKTFIFNDIMKVIMQRQGVKHDIPLKLILGKLRKERYQSFEKYKEDIIGYLIDNMYSQETLTEYATRLIKK